MASSIFAVTLGVVIAVIVFKASWILAPYFDACSQPSPHATKTEDKLPNDTVASKDAADAGTSRSSQSTPPHLVILPPPTVPPSSARSSGDLIVPQPSPTIPIPEKQYVVQCCPTVMLSLGALDHLARMSGRLQGTAIMLSADDLEARKLKRQRARDLTLITQQSLRLTASENVRARLSQSLADERQRAGKAESVLDGPVDAVEGLASQQQRAADAEIGLLNTRKAGEVIENGLSQRLLKCKKNLGQQPSYWSQALRSINRKKARKVALLKEERTTHKERVQLLGSRERPANEKQTELQQQLRQTIEQQGHELCGLHEDMKKQKASPDDQLKASVQDGDKRTAELHAGYSTELAKHGAEQLAKLNTAYVEEIGEHKAILERRYQTGCVEKDAACHEQMQTAATANEAALSKQVDESNKVAQKLLQQKDKAVRNAQDAFDEERQEFERKLQSAQTDKETAKRLAEQKDEDAKKAQKTLNEERNELERKLQSAQTDRETAQRFAEQKDEDTKKAQETLNEEKSELEQKLQSALDELAGIKALSGKTISAPSQSDQDHAMDDIDTRRLPDGTFPSGEHSTPLDAGRPDTTMNDTEGEQKNGNGENDLSQSRPAGTRGSGSAPSSGDHDSPMDDIDAPGDPVDGESGQLRGSTTNGEPSPSGFPWESSRTDSPAGAHPCAPLAPHPSSSVLPGLRLCSLGNQLALPKFGTPGPPKGLTSNPAAPPTHGGITTSAKTRSGPSDATPSGSPVLPGLGVFGLGNQLAFPKFGTPGPPTGLTSNPAAPPTLGGTPISARTGSGPNDDMPGGSTLPRPTGPFTPAGGTSFDPSGNERCNAHGNPVNACIQCKADKLDKSNTPAVLTGQRRRPAASIFLPRGFGKKPPRPQSPLPPPKNDGTLG
ncbi:hypothetical protein LTR36_007475 [Oleoguttula mirabilis]|uniref:Uncharacterized protein n=1 Tax=Oleoguttula mirabilis TaxID=1507867 RepID=A0AAV9J9Z4_9PEZI|nr:hypothetical protein LTR36_007475 [Oleoguttula mirabilis]